MTRWTLPLVLLVMATAAGAAHAQGFIIPELGTRKNAMGAAVGRPDDLSAIYHNPAALALLPGTQLAAAFGAVVLDVDLRLAPWSGSDQFIGAPESDGYYPRQNPTVFAPMPMIGASTNLWSDKIVGAIGIYVPNAAGADFGADKPSRYHIIDAYVFSAFFTAAVAYRPFPWLAVGLGGSAVYVRIQRRTLLYPVFPREEDPQNPLNLSGLLGKEAELELEGDDVRPAFNLGIQAWPHRTVSLGFMVLSRYDVSLEGPLTLKPGPGSLFEADAEIAKNRHRTEVIAPWIFAFGANWDITPWLEVGAELRYYLNSQVEEQVTTITEGGLADLMTSANMPSQIVTPKHLHDSFHFGGGFIVKPPLPLKLELMTGMHYENSSSPDNTVEVSAPSFDLAAFHVGARWAITDRLRVAAAYAHYWYLARETTDSITNPPTNFAGSGHTNMFTVVFEARVGPGIGVGK